jgi:hypothetical protein
VAGRCYSDADRFDVNRGLLHRLRGYESVTRVQGPVLALLALLSLLAPFMARGRARAAAPLFLLPVAGSAVLVPPE